MPPYDQVLARCRLCKSTGYYSGEPFDPDEDFEDGKVMGLTVYRDGQPVLSDCCHALLDPIETVEEDPPAPANGVPVYGGSQDGGYFVDEGKSFLAGASHPSADGRHLFACTYQRVPSGYYWTGRWAVCPAK